MKKILCLLFVLNLVLVLIGCSAKATGKTEEKPKAEIEKEDTKEVDKKETKKENNDNVEKVVNEKLKDFESIKEYLLSDDTFGMAYYEAQGENFNYDNYKLHHLDFTGDGKLDTVIVTFTEENDYRIVIFVTLENDKYKYYLTDLRAVKDSKFYCEDGFIIEEHNNYNELAFNVSLGDTNYIKTTNGVFNEEVIESKYDFNPDMKYKEINTVNKFDGYKDYEIDYKKYFYDETGKEYLITHEKFRYTFNKDSLEHEFNKEILVENNLIKIMSDNFIVGNDNALKTFEQVIEEKDSLKNAIDYYIENRQNFERNTRKKYIEDTLMYVNELYNVDIPIADEESVFDASITKVTLWGKNPIPSNAQDIFKVVKSFFIADGKNMDYDIKLEDGIYKVTCVDEVYSNKIRMMKFDRLVLNGEDSLYLVRDDEYVDIVFDTKENVYEKANDIVYPTILIKNLSQLNDLKHKSIWKTNVVIVPEKVEFIEYADEEELDKLSDFENETLYSKDKEMFIDYSKYSLVIIPQQNSINEMITEPKVVEITQTGKETSLLFNVHGRLEDVTLTFTPNALDSSIKPIEKKIGNVQNERVIVKAFMETDNATINVKGNYYYGMGDFEVIEFGLDDMRDPSAYEIIIR